MDHVGKRPFRGTCHGANATEAGAQTATKGDRPDQVVDGLLDAGLLDRVVRVSQQAPSHNTFKRCAFDCLSQAVAQRLVSGLGGVVGGNGTGNGTGDSFFRKDAGNTLGATGCLQSSGGGFKASSDLGHPRHPTDQGLSWGPSSPGNRKVRDKPNDAGSNVFNWVLGFDAQVVVIRPPGQPHPLGTGGTRSSGGHPDVKGRRACCHLSPGQPGSINLEPSRIHCSLTTCRQGPVD